MTLLVLAFLLFCVGIVIEVRRKVLTTLKQQQARTDALYEEICEKYELGPKSKDHVKSHNDIRLVNDIH